MPAPILETPRLRLRPHVLTDIAPFWAFYQTERAQFVNPTSDYQTFWDGFLAEVGSWEMTGHGSWAVETKEGALAGQVSIAHPPVFPEQEIGWIFFEEFEGKGYAFEAAQAALHWAWAHLPITTLVSYIDPAIARSIALARRLGAVKDTQAARPNGETAEECSVYRHVPDADGSPEAYA